MQNVMKASTDVERGRGHLKKAEDLATSSRKMKLILGGILGLVLLIVLLVILNEFGAFKSRCSLLDVNTLLDIVRNLSIFNHPFRIRPQSWLTPEPQKPCNVLRFSASYNLPIAKVLSYFVIVDNVGGGCDETFRRENFTNLHCLPLFRKQNVKSCHVSSLPVDKSPLHLVSELELHI